MPLIGSHGFFEGCIRRPDIRQRRISRRTRQRQRVVPSNLGRPSPASRRNRPRRFDSHISCRVPLRRILPDTVCVVAPIGTWDPKR